jgi:hypothetical protein
VYGGVGGVPAQKKCKKNNKGKARKAYFLLFDCVIFAILLVE